MLKINIILNLSGLAIVTILGFSNVAFATVDFDSPYLTGRSDRVFAAKDNSKWAYTIPTYLVRVSTWQAHKIDDRYVARFQTGVDPTALDSAKAALEEAGITGIETRYFRAVAAELAPDSTSIPDKFEYKLQALSELEQISGPIEMALSLKSKPKFLGKNNAKKLMESLFNSCNDHLGTLVYEFNGWLKGAPYLARTSIGIFAGPKDRLSCNGISNLKTLQKKLTFNIGSRTPPPTLNSHSIKILIAGANPHSIRYAFALSSAATSPPPPGWLIQWLNARKPCKRFQNAPCICGFTNEN